jgi:uncharacterized membrane protein YhaH (DUF805 family)
MTSNKDIYNYNTPKSGHEETRFWNIKGRITRKAFFLRLLFVIAMYSIFSIIFKVGFFNIFGYRIQIFYEIIYIDILPFVLFVFLLIQWVKRIHDTNNSGWYVFVPVYNLFLIFKKGTVGNNNYGIDPAPIKNVEFFDELPPELQVKTVRSKKPIKNIELVSDNQKDKVQNTSKRRYSPIYIILILIAALTYYYAVYVPNHRDSDDDSIAVVFDKDNDGILDNFDLCPEQAGNSPDGCFNSKYVKFNNDTRKDAYLSISYMHEGVWITQGWYKVKSKNSYTYELPVNYKGKQVYWFVDNSYGEEWSGNDKFFTVEKYGKTGFKVKGGRFVKDGNGIKVKKGFYKLKLTGETTNQGFVH